MLLDQRPHFGEQPHTADTGKYKFPGRRERGGGGGAEQREEVPAESPPSSTGQKSNAPCVYAAVTTQRSQAFGWKQNRRKKKLTV